MGWPQWTLAVLLGLGLIIAFQRDGQPRPPWSFEDAFTSVLIIVLILHAGGFWT